MNFYRIFSILVLLLVFDGWVLSVHACTGEPQKQQNPSQEVAILEKAIRAERRGRIEEAIRLYRQYLTRKPKDFVANTNLGLLFLKKGQPLDAIPRFKAAIASSPGRPEPVFGLANAYLGLNQPKDALEVLKANEKACAPLPPYWVMRAGLEARLESKSNAMHSLSMLRLENIKDINILNINILIEAGRIYATLGEKQHAESFFRKAYETAPNSDEVAITLASFLHSIGKGEEASAIFEISIRAHPTDANLYAAYAEIIRSASRERALEITERGITRNAKPEENLLTTKAQVLFEMNREEEALKILDAVLAKNPKYAPARVLRANVHFSRREYDLSAKDASEAIALNPKNSTTRRLLYDSLLLAGKHKEAREAVRDWLRGSPTDTTAMRLYAQMLLDEGKAEDARKILESALLRNPNDAEVLEIYARAAMLTGKTASAILLVEKAIEKGIKTSELLLRLGLCYRQINEIAKAIQVLDLAQKEFPEETRSWMIEASIHEQALRFDAALDVYRDFASRHPKNPYALDGIARMLDRLNRPIESAEAWLRFLEVSPEGVTPFLYAARGFAKGGQSEKAEEVWRMAYEKRPKDLALMTAHGQFLMEQKRYSDAEQVYLHMIEIDSMKSGPYLAAVEALEAQEKYNEAFELLKNGLEKHFHENIYLKTFETTASKAGRQDEYDSLLEKLLEEGKTSNASVLALVNAMARKGQLPALIERFQKILETERENAALWLGLSRAQALLGKGGEALESIEKAAECAPDNVEIVRLFASAAEVHGDKKRSAKAYGMLSKSLPDNVGYVLKQAGYLIEMGRKEEAKKLLTDASKRFPGNNEIRELMKRVSK